MPVVSPFIFQVADSSWDLMKVVRWEEPSPQTTPPVVHVHFIDSPNSYVVFDREDFELAMQTALDAL